MSDWTMVESSISTDFDAASRYSRARAGSRSLRANSANSTSAAGPVPGNNSSVASTSSKSCRASAMGVGWSLDRARLLERIDELDGCQTIEEFLARERASCQTASPLP